MMDLRKDVQRMLDFIESHLFLDLALSDIANNAGYSPWYTSRIFHKYVGISIKQYLRLRRITAAAVRLRDTDERILDIALTFGYQSQEAFARAFTIAFGIAPAKYRKEKPPLAFFTKTNLFHRHIQQGDQIMEKKWIEKVQIRFMQKPDRKFYYLQREGATDYHEFCEQPDAEEICGKLESLGGTLSGIVCGWMDEKEESSYAWGVEFPISEEREFDWLAVKKLPACEFAVFLQPPYNGEDHDDAIQAAWDASESWNPAIRNYEWATLQSPIYENETEEGYMVIKPIAKK